MWFWLVNEIIELVSGMPAPQFVDESSWVRGSELVQGSRCSCVSFWCKMSSRTPPPPGDVFAYPPGYAYLTLKTTGIWQPFQWVDRCTGGIKYLRASWMLQLQTGLWLSDRLCGLVVRVLDYRSRGPGLDSRALQKKVVGLERGPLSLVSTTEELLDRKVAAPV
jgi:hypothetical protein